LPNYIDIILYIQGTALDYSTIVLHCCLNK